MTDRADVLLRLNRLLWLFGTANDAHDHHCGDEGAELRLRATREIHALMSEHPFIAEVLPTLEWELDTKHVEGFGWSNLVDILEREHGVPSPYPGSEGPSSGGDAIS